VLLLAEEKGYCDQHSGTCKNIERLDIGISKIENDLKALEAKITEREKEAAVSGEQIKMIFKILNEIKDSIKQIADKLDSFEDKPYVTEEDLKDVTDRVKTLEAKPAKRWDDVTKTIATVAITAIVTFIMSKLLN